MRNHSASSAHRSRAGRAGRRSLVLILLGSVLLSGSWARRAAAYHPPDPGDKVYAIYINQADPELGRKRHNIGLLDVMITNLGIVGNPGFIRQESAASWQGGEYLYAAAMWIGAVASDNLSYVSTGAYENELRPSLAPVDHIYGSYEGVEHGNRPGFSSQPDDDSDGAMDEDPLNGKDDDGDGKIDEDYAAVSQQMFSCEYWDYTEEARARWPDHRPLNVKISQQSYAWSTEGANNFIGLDFKIVNEGFELLRRVYLGFFVDSDVGPKEVDDYFQDDGGAYYATDTTFIDPSVDYFCGADLKSCGQQTLTLNICYMNDIPDNGENAKGGDVPGYFGGMFLGHTTDPFGERAPSKVQVHTARFFNGSNPYPAGDPIVDSERYDLLQAGTKPTRPTGQPDDYRYCFSAGPFTEMAPGDVLQLQVAFVIGTGKGGMLTNAVAAQQVYNGTWRDVDGDPLGEGDRRTGIAGRETCLRALVVGEPLTWKDPCDSLNPTTRSIKEITCLSDNYVDNDCDCCTPLFKTQNEADNGPGLETLVHWVGSVAAPSPTTNIDHPDGSFPPAGDRSAEIAWDNLSELSADPTQRRILFTGYKIWRVEGWNRPIGAAGPRPSDWQLIANLSLQPEDSLREASPNFLNKYRNDIDSLYSVRTGSTVPGEEVKWYYPVGRYSYTDTSGIKNGMIYFYDVTAVSSWYEPKINGRVALEGSPSATEKDAVNPRWSSAASTGVNGVYVVPNPYIKGKNPAGWDLTPSAADPTGTKLAFVGLPDEVCSVKIYTLAGDLVETLGNETARGRRDGAVFWNLISRNGQDIVAGVYIYLVECGGKSKVGRFVVVR